MKNMVKFVIIAVAVSLIGSAAYAKKGDEGKKPDKERAAAVDSKQAQVAAKAAKDVNDKAAGKADKARRGARDKVKDANAAKDKAEEKADKVKKESEDKAKDVNAAGDKKESGSKKLFGFGWGKDHHQQLKALDEKSARTDAKYKEKIEVLEKELAAAQAANNTKKAEKLGKKVADAKQTFEKEIKKIEAKRAEIQAEMAKGK